jgi:hypothetical protein
LAFSHKTNSASTVPMGVRLVHRGQPPSTPQQRPWYPQHPVRPQWYPHLCSPATSVCPERRSSMSNYHWYQKQR